jgi:predicted dehydrogenase
MTLSLAILGCGGMGRRHLNGLRKLLQAERQRFELVAVCDVIPEAAGAMAALAEEMLGSRPAEFTSLADLLAKNPDLDGLTITTSPESHASAGIEAMRAGVNVMVEKPIAITVAEGLELIAASRTTGRKLSVAENYRRDPVNRLARAVIESGMLGDVFFANQSSSGSGNRINITPWRHVKRTCGILIDMGVHYTDILEYLIGPIHSLYGMSSKIDRRRVDANGVWHEGDAEDLTVGVLKYESGALANWVMNRSGRGHDQFLRVVHGTQASLSIPRDRSGEPLNLSITYDGSNTSLGSSELLAELPDFRLDDTTAALFGGDRVVEYDVDFPTIDGNLLAIEYDDFAGSIIDDREPEVSGEDGLRSLAIVYGFHESELAGKPVVVDELLSGKHNAYQVAFSS